MPIFWYVYGGWLLSCFIVLFSNEAMLNGFFVGLGLAFIQPLFGLIARLYERLAEFGRDRAYLRQEQERKRQQEAQARHHQQHQQEQTTRHQQRDDQQRQREEEARRHRQEQANHQHREQHQQKPPQTHEPDTRTPEEVLGLHTGWTQDDLLKAYRRESQRLHPDKWTGKPPTIREAMEQEFKRVQDAYKRLKGS
ncbi:MAG: J domain-containing protein [Thiofilum sp.]|uniref:J domain-containing protein n=1 Tax=Thiofilum sp. TaxID=2212733 RepID=UPI0025E94DC7|nr:J domain-containing protein [Thiofilum sp.]MBK8455563.1 J domain-containing protein [Thiofilum sp.]MBK8455576.1 J domain-containing protein [Thiofilum sp.]